MLYLFDQYQNLVGELGNKESQVLKQTEILNGLMSIDLELYAKYTKKLDDVEYVGHKGMENPDEFQMYKITNTVTTKDGMAYSGVHILFDDLQNYGYLKDKRNDAITCEGALQVITGGTDWTVGQCDVTPVKRINFYDVSRLDALKSMLQTWNVELQYRLVFKNNKIVAKIVEVKKRVGTDTGERFVYGSNAIEVTQEINRTEVVSRIVPRGKRIRDTEAYKKVVEDKKNYENAKIEAQRDKARLEQQYISERDKLLGIKSAKPIKTEQKKVTASDLMGEFDENAYPEKVEITNIEWKSNSRVPMDKPKGQEYLELPEITARFGYPDGTPRTKVVEFSNIEDPEELLELAYDTLVQMSRPLVDFKTKVLKKTDTYLGDRVAVIRHDLGLYYTTRVFKIVRDLKIQSYEIEFGDGISTQRYNPNMSKRITLEELHDEATTQKEFVREVQDLLTEKMYNQDGYNYELDAGNDYGLPAGYYSFNRAIDDNPTKAIYVGAGMMAIANSHKGNGDWDWRSFGTGDGFVADLIVAGMLRGGKVRWNLETGTFLIGDDAENYSLWWDGATLHLRNVNIDLENNPSIEKMNRKLKNELVDKLNNERKEIDAQNDIIISDIKELKTNIQVTDSKIQTSATQLREEILKDANGFTTERLASVESSFQQTADGLSSRVKSIERETDPNAYNSLANRLIKAENNITQTSNSLSSEISAVDNKYSRYGSRIAQTERDLEFKVSKDNVISAINLSPEYAKIKAKNIDLTGDVSVQGDLKTITSSYQPNIWVHGTSIDFYEPNQSKYQMGTISPIKFSGTSNYYLNLRHNGNSAISISYAKSNYGYLDDNDSSYYQYITFDKYHNIDGNGYTAISVKETTEFTDRVTFDKSPIIISNSIKFQEYYEMGVNVNSGSMYMMKPKYGGYALFFNADEGHLFMNKYTTLNGGGWTGYKKIFKYDD